MSYGIFEGLSVRMKQSQHQLLRGMKGKGEGGTKGQREKRETISTQRFRVNLRTICPKYTKEKKKKSELEEMVRPVNFYLSVHGRGL